jgi:hypothetical protein
LIAILLILLFFIAILLIVKCKNRQSWFTSNGYCLDNITYQCLSSLAIKGVPIVGLFNVGPEFRICSWSKSGARKDRRRQAHFAAFRATGIAAVSRRWVSQRSLSFRGKGRAPGGFKSLQLLAKNGRVRAMKSVPRILQPKASFEFHCTVLRRYSTVYSNLFLSHGLAGRDVFYFITRRATSILTKNSKHYLDNNLMKSFKNLYLRCYFYY